MYNAIPLLNSLARGDILFVDAIVLVCFGLYVVAIAINFGNPDPDGNIFGMLSPTFQALQQLGMGGRIPLLEGKWWSLLTATYLHGDILHIGFNMLWLRDMGPQVEREFGPSRFLLIYTVAGLAGAGLSALAGTSFFVGASGAIFGLFGALIFFGRSRGGTFGTAIFRRTLFWAGLLFLYGLAGTNTDNWGHFGGLAGGFFMAFLLNYEDRLRQTLGHHLAALTTLAFIIVCFAFMLVNFFTFTPPV